MDNIELENKIKEIINIENYFDMVIAIKDFEGEYKKSEFFKLTKKSLEDVVKEAKLHYITQLVDLKDKIQKLINGLDISHLNDLFDQIGTVFGQENMEIMNTVNEMKDIMK